MPRWPALASLLILLAAGWAAAEPRLAVRASGPGQPQSLSGPAAVSLRGTEAALGLEAPPQAPPPMLLWTALAAGLAISRQLVGRISGRIGIHSDPNRGSTSWFTATFVRARDPEAVVPPAPAMPIPRWPPATPSPRRLLLVEDNPINQTVAIEILRRLGYPVDIAHNGREALRHLATTPYDLVLMDCQMPEMDGFEATRQVRAGADGVLNPAVPIVAMTANAMRGDRERCLAAGMDDYVAKPVHPPLLAEVLRKWLEGPERGTSTRPVDLPGDGPQAAPEPSPTVPPAPAARPFDAEAFLQRVMGDAELARSVLVGFDQDMERLLDLLEMPAPGPGGLDPAHHAHTIKGAAGLVGAEALHHAAARIEACARQGDLAGLRHHLPSARLEFRRFQQAARGFLHATRPNDTVSVPADGGPPPAPHRTP